MLIKVLSNFLFLPISLDGKKGKNKYSFGKKFFFKTDFLILLLYNSFEDVFLLLLFYSLIVLSSFCLFTAKSGVGIFGKDNIRKDREDNPGTKA